jgi:hypothetical protein
LALDLELDMAISNTKLLLAAIFAWVACLTTVLTAIFIIDGGTLGIPDLTGAAGATLLVSVFVITLLYIPGLFWLRRRMGGCSPAIRFPLMSSLVLNAPIFLITGLLAGRALVVTEAFVFVGGFIVLGAAFGLGFVWSCRENRS